MENKKVVYCDKCRDKLITDNEVYLIVLDSPSGFFGNLMGNGKSKFRLCRKDFTLIADILEERIIGKKRELT